MIEIISDNHKLFDKIAKVPYLQYEIMEVIFGGAKDDIEMKVGFSKGSLVIGNAIKSLIKKGLLDNNLDLTDTATKLVKLHYYERHTYPKYTSSILDISSGFYKPTLFDNFELGNGNGDGPVFRWYKYLEDFPHHFVSECEKRYKLSSEYYILDPFAGSGTTLIRAKMDGYRSIGVDTNPAMVFISRQKLNWIISTDRVSNAYNTVVSQFLNVSDKEKVDAINGSVLSVMPQKELNQWLSPVKQNEIALMFKIVDSLEDDGIRDFFKFLITKTAVDVSYVAFCPGTTFYPFRKKPDFLTAFRKLIQWVITDLQLEKVKNNSNIESIIIEGSIKDKKTLEDCKGKIDLVITSPPYPNDLEYTRQTRLEMYLLGYVRSMNDVQKIKRKMVKGSTKLIYNSDFPIETLSNLPSIKIITGELRERLRDKNWGFDYPKMVEMYFSDMYISLANIFDVLINDGTCILVVGDQTIKGVIIPVAEILAELSEMIGFRKNSIELHRERRSTGHDIPIPEENLVLIK